MIRKPDIKKLKKFLALGTEKRTELAHFMNLTNSDSIYAWVTKGSLPKTKRRFILGFINSELRRKA